MVCVDRIITSACFQPVNDEAGVTRCGEDFSTNESVLVKGNGEGSCSKNMIECKICQEEDEEKEMEAPCGCSGTLKYAHRKCIQRWCNKKGDITCEICNQVFAPNYSLPPPRPSSDGMAIDIRQGWGPQFDLHDPRLLAFAAEHRLLQAEYEDYDAANSSGIACCRAVALILMLLLLVRHALLVMKESGLVQDASAFFNVSFLQFAGFLLPCYVMARALYVLQCRRRRQG